VNTVFTLSIDVDEFGENGFVSLFAVAVVKLYVYGYTNGIRSSRKLEAETHPTVMQCPLSTHKIWKRSGAPHD
jgi:transposase